MKQRTEIGNLTDEVGKLNLQIENIQKSLKQTEQRAENAEKNQKVVTEYRDRTHTEYKSKCKNCSKEQLENAKCAYELRKKAIEGYTYGLGIFAFLVTLLTAIRSDVVFDDFRNFFVTIGKFISSVFKNSFWGITKVSGISEKINQPVVSAIIKWLIVIILAGILIILIIGLIIFIVQFIADKMKSAECIDLGLFLLSVTSLILIVFLGDWIKPGVKLNLVVLWIIIITAYIVGRIYHSTVQYQPHDIAVSCAIALLSFGLLYGVGRFVAYIGFSEPVQTVQTEQPTISNDSPEETSASE